MNFMATHNLGVLDSKEIHEICRMEGLKSSSPSIAHLFHPNMVCMAAIGSCC